MIEEGRWDDMLNYVPIHPGDFFRIEPGTIHAIMGGTPILETQQSSGRHVSGVRLRLHTARWNQAPAPREAVARCSGLWAGSAHKRHGYGTREGRRDRAHGLPQLRCGARARLRREDACAAVAVHVPPRRSKVLAASATGQVSSTP